MKVTLIQATPQPIKLIADIASICYGRQKAKNPKELVKYLYDNGHHSVFEHIYFTFKIESISRACSHQLVRHRMCSFTQRSQRYCDESQNEWVLPQEATPGSTLQYKFQDYIQQSQQAYQDLISNGMSKEDARYILPNATSTDMYLSCNLRQLIHLAQERLCIKAQWEIRKLLKAMVELVDNDLKIMLTRKCQNEPPICRQCFI